MSKRMVPALLSLVTAALVALSGCSGAKPTTPDAPAPAAEQPAKERIVKHAMGETPVPAEPKRVVVLDTGELDSALMLGIKPVGAVTVFQDGDFQAYLKDKTEGIKKVGTVTQPNLEAIAALKPDLILSSKLRHQDIYDKLKQIAPTVFTESVGVSWKENLKVHAEALGKSKEAEALMAAYAKRNDEFKKAMGDKLSTLKVSVVRSLADHNRMMAKASFIGTVLQDAGLQRVPSQDQDVFMVRATEENIPDMDGDVMFLTYYRPADGGETMIDKMKKHPLWSQLKVVKENKVYEVPDDYWMLGIGIGAAQKVQDDLLKLLIDKQ